MAPFHQAVNVQLENGQAQGSESTFKGYVDPEWTVAAVPHGGYILALIVESCIAHQQRNSSPHPDPVHITAHYLRASSSKLPFAVHVKTIKTGRGYSTLRGELVQAGALRVTAMFIMGDLTTPKPQLLTLHPPYMPRIPLQTHPSGLKPTDVNRPWMFKDHMKLYDDPQIPRKHGQALRVQTPESETGGKTSVLEWGAWAELRGAHDKITTAALVVFADIFKNVPGLLPKSERPDLGVSWFPTMVMSVEFKAPIPKDGNFAQRTVGVYSSGRFINGPDGRHDAYVEVWTAPSGVAEGKDEPGWRENQICLATSTQMALTVPVEVNLNVARL